MAPGIDSAESRKVLFVSNARSASNLLLRILVEGQSSANHQAYHFGLDVIKARKRLSQTSIQMLSVDDLAKVLQAYQKSAQQLQKYFDTADMGRQVTVVKEHANFMQDPVGYSLAMHGNSTNAKADTMDYTAVVGGESLEAPRTNPTVLPDNLLYRLQALFLIRHPALTIPSYARVLGSWDRAAEQGVTLKQSYDLYRWWTAQDRAILSASTSPLLLDADDVITNPALIARVSKMIGLNPEEIAYTWPAATEKEKASWDTVKLIMTKTLAGSQGVVVGKLGRDLDLVQEVEAWKEEFPSETAAAMEQMLKSEMPYYDYLWAMRERPDTPS